MVFDIPVVPQLSVELFNSCRRWEFTVQQQQRGLFEAAVLGELFYRIPTVIENAFLTVDIRNIGFSGLLVKSLNPLRITKNEAQIRPSFLS
jgi:hypothetical protein